MALMTKTWTVAEYHRLVDEGILDDQPVELLNGEIVVMSPEGVPHASISVDAGEYLMRLLGERAQMRQAKPITLTAVDSEPEPDLAVVERLGPAYRGNLPNRADPGWRRHSPAGSPRRRGLRKPAAVTLQFARRASLSD